MCAVFGLIDYKNIFVAKQREQILKVLSKECEVHGTDATGFAFNSRNELKIFKRPVDAHKMHLHLPEDSNIILGHTRMATQGDKHKNFNNHPFFGNAGGERFALAHNGVIYNDDKLKKELEIPPSNIETDSYIAVQVIEKLGELSEKSLAEMAEKVRGSFVFTLLDKRNNSYFVKGDNPLALYHFKVGFYICASTNSILNKALNMLGLDKFPSSTGKLLFTLMSALAQFERDVIADRTREGLASARARGRKGGRPAADSEMIRKAVKLYNSRDYSVKEITELTGVRRSTLYKHLQK